jgi:HAD superfamily hydrolase (TIGR01509 family)
MTLRRGRELVHPRRSAIVITVTIRAIAFDLGGVLEDIGPAEDFVFGWRARLGLSEMETADLPWPMTRADPDDQAKTGAVTEAQYRQRCLAAVGLAGAAADEFMASFWNWYCGALDTKLASFAARLRPRYRTAILSNSVAGARRQEQARFGFAELVDVIIYSDEAGLAKPNPEVYRLLCSELGVEPAEVVFLDNRLPNVEAACELGIHGVLHEDTATSIAAVNALLDRPD